MEGRVLASSSFDADSHYGLAPQLPRIASALEKLIESAGANISKCGALGMAFPSLVDSVTCRVLAAYGKYTDAPMIDLSRWARATFGLELVLENDARAALLGEWRAGSGKNCNDLVMVTLGTGLGTSAIIGGKLLRGKHGQAGVLGGHFTIRPGGRLCTCGNRGCAEAEASTSVLEWIILEQPEFLTSRIRELERIDYAGLFRLAREQDACAEKIRARTIEVWTAMIVNLIHAYDPDRVIVGGGILAGADQFFPELVGSVKALAHTPWGEVDIVPANLGDDAALVGCDVLAREPGLSW
jgi:glucokinase